MSCKASDAAQTRTEMKSNNRNSTPYNSGID